MERDSYLIRNESAVVLRGSYLTCSADTPRMIARDWFREERFSKVSGPPSTKDFNECIALISPTEDYSLFAHYPPGVIGKCIDSHHHSHKSLQPQLDDVSFELLRRSEQPTAVVHETICEQVADAMPLNTERT